MNSNHYFETAETDSQKVKDAIIKQWIESNPHQAKYSTVHISQVHVEKLASECYEYTDEKSGKVCIDDGEAPFILIMDKWFVRSADFGFDVGSSHSDYLRKVLTPETALILNIGNGYLIRKETGNITVADALFTLGVCDFAATADHIFFEGFHVYSKRHNGILTADARFGS
jgi:hypothetical protein